MTKKEYIMSLVALMKIANMADAAEADIHEWSDHESWCRDLEDKQRRQLQSTHHDAMGRIIANLIGEDNYWTFSEGGYDEKQLDDMLRPHNVEIGFIMTDDGDTHIRLENVNQTVKWDLEEQHDSANRVHVTWATYPDSYNGSLEILVGKEQRNRVIQEVMDTITAWNN